MLKQFYNSWPNKQNIVRVYLKEQLRQNIIHYS